MKPLGGYIGHAAPPHWMSIGMLDPAQPLPPQPRPGFGWVVQIGFHESPLEPAGRIAARAKATLDAAGRWGDVLAFVYGEEWFERFDAGAFAPFGLPAGHPEGVAILRDYLGRQHAQIVEVTGKPVLWVTHRVTPERQPPACTAFVGIDAYPVDGQRFEDFAPLLLETERHAQHPLVSIARWYRATGDVQGSRWREMSAAPTANWAEGYAWLLARPQWVALIGFVWASRPAGHLVGLQDMPEARAAVERALGVEVTQ